MRDHRNIHDDARGRWRSLLPQLGVPAAYLSGKHGPCPICGGTDRWRFDDKEGKGTYYCNNCGSGTGVDLVMKVQKCDFTEAAKLIRDLCGTARIEVPKAKRGKANADAVVDRFWNGASPLNGMDPASKYLQRRGMRMSKWPAMLRYLTRARYKHADGHASYHPAMVARFVSPDRSQSTVHLTYLDDAGNKADLAGEPEKKVAACSMPCGGAVRLAPSAETMGIAEGIETAMSAMLLFDVPVWAGLNTGGMVKWEPPPSARNILIFADNDDNFAGHAAAYSLAYRLANLKVDGVPRFHVEVRLPDFAGDDWNNVLLASKE